MGRRSILIAIPDAPFPARLSGVSIRYAPLIEHLSRLGDVDVLQLVPNWTRPISPASDGGLIRRFETLEIPWSTPPLWRRALVRARTAVYPRPPHVLFSFHARSVRQRLAEILSNRKCDTALWGGGSLAWLALPILRQHAGRVVLDAVDSVYSIERKASSRSPLVKWDLRWLRRWELEVARRFDETAYISRNDIELLQGQLPESERCITYLPNGVLYEDYIEDIADIDGIDSEDTVLAFLGHMAYGPNIQAALTLRRLFDQLRAQHPKIKLLIIGRSPSASIKEQATDPDIIVTGTVDNIWPYVNRADIFVFPMETGAGQQNKVMEAMYARKPVVSTPIGNNGIVAKPGEHLLIGESDAEILAEITRLIQSAELRADVGAAGRTFVMQNYSWTSLLPRFERFCFAGSSGASNG